MHGILLSESAANQSRPATWHFALDYIAAGYEAPAG